MLTGIFLVTLGSFCAASFYVPLNRVKGIAWEVYWPMAGLFSWLITPLAVALLTVPNLFGLYGNLDITLFVWPFVFGMLWGIGGLTYGLTLRYLGVSLGTAIANGIISALGTLVPLLFMGTFGDLFASPGGIITFIGVLISFLGIAFSGLAGLQKDKELSENQKKQGIKDFNLKLGLTVGLISGLMSACFNFGLTAAAPIAEASVLQGTPELFKGNAGLCIVLLGGLLVNFIYCFYKASQNHTLGDWLKVKEIPIFANWIWILIGGSGWYLQMMFLEMGKSQMGRFDYAAWAILMSMAIVFSTMWGFITGEWKNSSKKTLTYVFTGLLILILSAVVIGIGPNVL